MTGRGGFNAGLLVDSNVELGRGAKIACVASDAAVSYDGLRKQVNRMGNLLRELGVRSEERVLLVLDDTTVFQVAFLGTIKIGAVPVPVGVLESRENFRHFFEDSGARFVVCDRDRLQTLQLSLEGCDARFLARDAQEGAVELEGALAQQADELTALVCDPEDVAFWLYSSGSTGRPKGVLHAHRSIEVACECFARRVLAIGEDDRIFSTTKLHHAYGLGNGLFFPFYFGATAVLMDGRPSPERLLRTVRSQRPTVYCSVPALYSVLADDPSARESFDSVRLCISAAEVLPLHTFDRWRECVGIEIVEGIGCTEMLQAYCSNRPGEVLPGTTGWPVPGYELRLAGADGAVLDGPSLGQLEVRGGSIAVGYRRDGVVAMPSLRDGWHATGDRFERGPEGAYRYVGREDEMMKVGGLWVSPLGIETVLLEHPAVAAAGVVGVEIADRLRIAAFVERALDLPGDAQLAEELRERCQTSLREHEYPHIVRFIDALPRTPTGKPQRFKLREIADRYAAEPSPEPMTSCSRTDDQGSDYGSSRLGEAAILELVLAHVASIQGHDSRQTVDPTHNFKALGLDSIAAFELRNRLSRDLALELPSTLAFDAPTPARAAALIGRLAGGAARATASAPRTRRDAAEPVAIVGMGCRLPGGARSPSDLWGLLAAGVDAIGEFPDDRGWDLRSLYHPDPDHAGTSYVRMGGFLEEVTTFDWGFFSISPREALAMDPQQRLMLEVVWEALEHAGIDPLTLRATATAVYAGAMSSDYATGSRVPPELEGLALAGAGGSALSGRVAYTFGFEGPAITIDTACSSSLVALHEACKALRQGECDLALAGGVTVLATPSVFTSFSRQRGLASDGRCKAFATAADGAGFAEGACMLVLTRLEDALDSGREVLALIRGSAVNQDGASNGLTAPSGPAQERVIHQALADAGLRACDVDAVEAHGTGTSLGDPIEANALLATYGQGRKRPLWLGSVKSNVGHTQAAAGAVGVLKVVEALRHGLLPKTLHVDEPSSHVDWSAGEVALLTDSQQWRSEAGPRRAGVSSFGASGTNAHVILEEAPSPVAGHRASERPHSPPAARLFGSAAATTQAEPTIEGGTDGCLAWVLSARNDRALRAQAQRLIDALDGDRQLGAEDVGLSLAMRSSFEERAVVVGNSGEALRAALRDAALGHVTKHVVRGSSASACEGGTVFLFPGQGSQWPGMALGLLDGSPLFADKLRSCEQALATHVDWSLEEVLRGVPGAPLLERVDVVQPTLFAVMVSLAELWQACGVKPSCVVGHSQGEIAAAHVAGGLSLEDAARIVALRSRLLASIAGRGGMVSVPLGALEVQALLEDFPDISLAAVNGPSQTVVSGSEEALTALLKDCRANNVNARRIPVDYASHSPQIETIERALLDACASIAPRSGEVPFYSTVDAAIVDTGKLDSDYWYRNLRQPVQFQKVVEGLLEERHRAFVEVSPHPVLSVGVAETIEQTLEDPAEALIAASLRRNEGDAERFCVSLAQAWARGVAVDWTRLFADPGAKRVPLPTYPFQRERAWIEPAAQEAGGIAAAGQTPTGHPLLSATIALPDGGQLFTGRVSIPTHPWLADHAVLGNVLVPATAFLELALYAGEQLDCPRIAELAVHAPLILHAQGALQLQLTLGVVDSDGSRQLHIHARSERSGDEPEEAWTHHASGALTTPGKQPLEHSLGHAEWPPSNCEPIDLGDIYEQLAGRGLEYGPAFRGLRAAWRDGEDILAEVALAPEQGSQAAAYAIHPALLDAALHASQLLEPQDGEALEETLLPFAWSDVELHGREATALRVRVATSAEAAISLTASAGGGIPLVTVGGLSLRPVSPAQLAKVTRSQTIHTVCWQPVRPSATIRSPAGWALLRSGAGELERELSVLAIEGHDDLAALAAASAAGEPPMAALADCRPIDVTAPAEPSATHTASAPDYATGILGAARANALNTLKLLKAWIAEERLADTLLILITRNALATEASEDVSDLAASPIWGLVRAAQSENPGRFILLDVDERPDWSALEGALELDEPQLALRAGALLVPRVTNPPDGELAVEPTGGLCASGTVLITGGTGGAGGQLARHLVKEHGIKHLVLAGRSGSAAPRAGALERELQRLGASVTIAACDVSDRDALARLLAAIPLATPLKGVIHAAGVLDDGVLATLTPEQFDRVFAPKLIAAAHLHELTAGLNLDMFVLCSSVAATLGNAGQANYAAANAFLDALAAHRQARGLPATSIAWGLWAQDRGMTAALGGVDRERLARTGVGALSTAEALEVFDRALADRRPHVIGARLDMASLRAQARAGLLAPILRTIVRVPAPQTARGGSLARDLHELPEHERERAVLGFVRAHAATVLGYDGTASLPDHRTWKDLGLDSLAAVELSNRLAAQTGTRLATTTVFAHATPIALAKHLSHELAGRTSSATPATVRTATVTAAEEPVAIVGMGCRLPGGVGSPRELWDLVVAGADAIGEFPSDRGWDLASLCHPDPDRAGTSYASEGGFIEDVGAFDAPFFSIGPREALVMDPQQRLMLEVVWEALEHAGIDPLTLRASATAVYAGAMSSDYSSPMAALPSDLERYRGPGNATSVLSGRVAYALDLAGEAISIDCACSSSLVAIHQACRALQSGDCSMAIAGGVTVMATADTFIQFSRQRGLAQDGRCKPFAQAADGASFAEGVGVLVLERLSDARAHGHEVLAVVRGSAVNQDGASYGLTAPNGPAQERVIRRALENARLSPAEIDVVEGHGTGTTLGDPIEAQALLATYGCDRERPLWLGSVKSNVGHTQAAAGVTGVIKMVEAIRQGVMPATLHVDRPTEHVDWSAGRLRLLVDSQPWAETGRPRRAAVSAFGLSGTNAHLILEQAPSASAAPAANAQATPLLGTTGWTLSARGDGALRAHAARMHKRVVGDSGLGVADVGVSLASRSQLEWRGVVVGEHREDLLGGLSALASRQRSDRVVVGRAGDLGGGRAVFLFPGQGSQWVGMAVGLLDASQVFASHLRACEEALAGHVDWSLEAVLRGEPDAPTLEGDDVVQPALFAVMVSLARLWQACGVQPAAVVGHSQGEIAAAHIAGGLSLEDAARLVALRSRALVSIAGQGGLLAVAQSSTEIAGRLEGSDEQFAIAAINGPLSTVVSGDGLALDAFAGRCESEGIRTRRIPIDYASHSAVIEQIRTELLDACSAITPRRGKIPFHSTVTAGALDTGALDRDYWYRNLREPVLFEQTIRSLLAQGYRAFIEASPHPVLTQGVAETVEQELEDPEQALILGSLRREEGTPQRFCISLAQAWVRGVAADWAATFDGTEAKRAILPTYPFQRERYWLNRPTATRDLGSSGLTPADHPLPSATIELPDGEWQQLGDDRQPAAQAHDASTNRLLAVQLAGARPDERDAAILELVCAEATSVLARPSDEALDVMRPLKELGLHSVQALELRDRLQSATATRLPTSFAFDHPSAAEMARELGDLLEAELGAPEPDVPEPDVPAWKDSDGLAEASDHELLAIVDGGRGA